MTSRVDTGAMRQTAGEGRDVLLKRILMLADEVDRLQRQLTQGCLTCQEMGRRFESLIVERNAMLDNLTSVQTRCTELTVELRETRESKGRRALSGQWRCDDCGARNSTVVTCMTCGGADV